MSLRRNEDSEVEEEEAALLGAPTGRVGDGGRRRSDSREPAIDCRLAALLLLFLGVAISAASRIAALRLAASNVDSDGGGGYSVVPEIVLKGLAGAVRTQAGAVDALLRESREVGTEVEMALRDQARARESAAAAAAPPTSSAAPPAAGLPLPLPTRACPEGCTEHGNCNELTGECTCGLTRRGPACQEPTMPACMLGGRGARAPSASPGGVDEVINLSFLVAESFWGGLRDVRTDDPRRKKVAHRWVGMVTCDCVEQALAVLSLSRASAPPRFPERIGHTELSLQRALCIDDPRPVGQLWEEGVAAGAKWSYVPLVAWLKPFPAHAPHLLPLHLVNEAHWVDIPKKDPHLMRLRRNPIELLALARARRDGGRPRVSLKTVLRLGPSDGHLSDGPALVPLRRCGAHQCHRAGWCGGWDAKAAPPRCQCLSRWSAVSEAVARAPEERVDVSVALRRVGRGRGAAAECAPQPRAWVQGMDRAAYARSHEQMEAADAERNWLGEDRWRSSVAGRPRTKACPNECLGRGSCAFGFCHCRAGFWGLDCGLSRARVASLAAEASPGPRIYVYEVPAMLRRSCGPWRFPEDLGDAILSSRHLTVRPDQADLFWIYGCPNGDIVMPMLRWVKHSAGPWWNASVAAGRPRHVLSLPHEEGWAEVWVLLRSWLAFGGDHGNSMRGWDDLHPASPTRQLVCLQLHGSSDYTPAGSPPPRRGVSGGAACRICFQPGKDVVVPGFPSIMDYPADYSHSGRATQCEKLAAARTSTARTDRSRTPRLFFAGVVQTKSHGPGLYEASRLVLYSCWKNRSSEHGFSITQTENVLVSVNQWEVEPPVDAFALTRQASTCVVPEGKIGSYGHRAVPALLLGCVPVLTKERHSHGHFDEVLPWSRIALHVPPSEVPRLPQLLDEAPIEAMRTAAAPLLRRLLWVSIYGACHLLPGEGGTADALDTLLEVLRRPRSHFTPPTAAPDRAPEFLKELFPWLRSRGAPECTRGYQCFDEHSRSCGLPRGAPTVYVPPRK